jgi:hypothetical protein
VRTTRACSEQFTPPKMTGINIALGMVGGRMPNLDKDEKGA